jgi:uncharacterized membrane protein YeiH
MLLYVFDLMGVAVFAVSGALAASRRALDLFGIVVVAAITAIGGGTLRDLLLDRHPIFWMVDPNYLTVTCAAALLTVVYVRYRPAPRRALLVADALGLALFAISGARIAEGSGLGPVIVILLGTMTGVAGGILRDVLSAQVPLILQRDIYATAAVAGISVYLLLQWLGVPRPVPSAAGMLSVVVLRLLAIERGMHLPVVHPLQEPESPP